MSFDDYATKYDELLHDPLRDRFAGGSEFFIRQKCRSVERRLARLGGARPLRVLDVGCGQGTALACFGRDVRVFGADVSHPMLHEAIKRGPVTVQEPLHLPFADNTFDAVYAFCIYHHIPDDDHVAHLRELRRVVAEGGEVMVYEHNPYNPVTARIFARAPIDRGCHMIRPADLRARFLAAGFDEVSQGYLLFVPERLGPVLGFMEPALSWLPLGGQYFVAGTKVGGGVTT
jgi:ubiquinone/menaquinone biosynthesis C-methylase UbiE